MRRRTYVVAVLLLTGGLLVTQATAATGPFTELLGVYHEVRSALVQDNLTRASEHAREIEKRAAELGKDAGLADEAVPDGSTQEWLGLVEEIAAAAAQLGSAEELETAREAFFALSKPMGRYRKLVADGSTIVAFCPMEKKAWLQPDGEFENPYLGQEMPTCGQRIPD